MLINWVFRHSKGYTVRSSQGRPRALDKTALLDLQSWLRERGAVTELANDMSEVKNRLNEA